MAGFHEEHLLFICDEASGIDDSIYETIEGALTTEDAKLLLCGNPTKNSGVFTRSFFEDRELYYTAKVSCMDTHRVADHYSQRLIKQYGLDYAINLDGGSSAALFYNDEYMEGPGRNIPNVIMFAQ